MSTAAATWSQPELAKGQVGIIQHDQQSFNRDLVEPGDCANGLAGGIHVCLRLTKQSYPTACLSAGDTGIELLFVCPICAPTPRDRIKNQETRIVPRSRVLPAGIA